MFALLASLLLMMPVHDAPVKHSCSIVFAGDMMQHKSQIDSAHRNATYRYDECFDGTRHLSQQADIAVCNLEAPLAGEPYSGYPMFSAPDEFASAISEAGYDIFLTANNHCLDKGGKGLLRTLDVLDSLGIRHLGTYRNQAERDSLYPLIVDANGVRLALLDYTYGTNGMPVPSTCIVNLIDTVQMAADLNRTRQLKADCVIVCIHWGEEYRLKQNREQENLAKWLISRGADHIIGSHPHVIQPVVMLSDANSSFRHHVTAYSLGNFISGMSAANTDRGLLIELKISRFLSTVWLDGYNTYHVKTLRPSVNGKPYFQVIQE